MGTIRREFQEWAKKKGFSLERYIEANLYKDPKTQESWGVWCASRNVNSLDTALYLTSCWYMEDFTQSIPQMRYTELFINRDMVYVPVLQKIIPKKLFTVYKDNLDVIVDGVLFYKFWPTEEMNEQD